MLLGRSAQIGVVQQAFLHHELVRVHRRSGGNQENLTWQYYIPPELDCDGMSPASYRTQGIGDCLYQ
ncbi:hypothetical protein ACHAWU_001895 [Discostella pseudostelligera]|uniref:Uncharacterized protein n=1 Tax=Discostella pseudostelligera TaxID=259834 RepID=A0ABD3MWB6_9STRA